MRENAFGTIYRSIGISGEKDIGKRVSGKEPKSSLKFPSLNAKMSQD